MQIHCLYCMESGRPAGSKLALPEKSISCGRAHLVRKVPRLSLRVAVKLPAFMGRKRHALGAPGEETAVDWALAFALLNSSRADGH